MLKRIGLVLLLFSPALTFAQNQSSTVGDEASLWAGGEVSVFADDWACPSLACSHLLVGPALFFNLNLPRRIGVEGEARWTNWNGLNGGKQSNYLAGPRYRFYRRGQLDVWGKGLLGGGWITTPDYPEPGSVKGSFFAIVPGITAEYRVKDRWAVRADYEYQIWPSYPPHGLNPQGVSIGVSYRFLGD